MTDYDSNFYRFEGTTALDSAKIVVPLVLEFGEFASVLDVGCGVGGWLKIFLERGVKNAVGVDGYWLKGQELLVPKNLVFYRNLEEPLVLKRKFDLVVSLETAEHISPNKAEVFVDSLIRHGDVVLFSAAIPGQKGIRHINTQWPDFWADLFRKHGFLVVDCLRGRLWDNNKVATCYVQNTLFFVKKDKLCEHPLLQKAYTNEKHSPLSLVHPKTYEEYLNYFNSEISVRDSLRLALRALTKRRL